MKFIIKKQILNENLNNVSKALSNKNLIPILSGIKFELKEEGLYITATDDDITVQSFIDKKDIIEIYEMGSIIIPGRYFIDIIKKIPTQEINLETDGLILNITTSKSKYNLNGLHYNDFPERSLELNDNPIIISSNIIKNIITQTSFSVSNQESRPILTGINFIINKNQLECVATDSYRLSKKTVKLEENFKEKINLVIPGRNLIELSKILDEKDFKIELHVFSNNLLFKFSNVLFQSRLLNGTYPDTSKLIKEDHILKLTVNLEEFYNVIDRASLLTNEKEKNIIKMEVIKNKLIISSTSLEIGNIEEEMEIEKNNEENIKIAFSSKYMMEAIRSFKSEKIDIYLNGEIKPIILKEKENDNLIQLILPIKTF